MKKKVGICLLVMLISAMFGFFAFIDANLVFQNKRIDLKDAKLDDFHDSALVEGEVYMITGPFASLEETNKVYGIPVGKKETFYYLVGNTTHDKFYDAVNSDTDNIYDGITWFVLSASDKKLVEKLDDQVSKFSVWAQNYNNFMMLIEESGFDPDIDMDKLERVIDMIPTETVKIGGILKSQSSDEDYEAYRDDFMSKSDISIALIAKVCLNS